VCTPWQVGYVDFVIKLDAPDKTTLSDGRKMSHHLQALKPGDSIYLRGPHGTIEYKVCFYGTTATEIYTVLNMAHVQLPS
jgi:ferredoxin-NADP reductase